MGWRRKPLPILRSAHIHLHSLISLLILDTRVFIVIMPSPITVFAPIKHFVAGFVGVGAIWYSLPITEEMKAQSKYLNPHGDGHGDGGH
eukprot:CFRG5216T1